MKPQEIDITQAEPPRGDDRFIVILTMILAIVFAVFTIISLNACKTADTRHAVRAAKLMNKAAIKSYPTVAEKCGLWFPPVAEHDTTLIQGETILKTDTLRSKDTVTIDGIQYVNRYIDVYHTRVDTFRQKVVEVNNAALQASADSNSILKIRVAGTQALNADLKKELHKFMWLFFGLLTANVLAAVVWLIIKFK